MIIAAWIIGGIVALVVFWNLMDGLIEGYTDVTVDGYSHEALVDFSMKFGPIKWGGWFVAYYGRRTFRDWKDRHDYRERRAERRRRMVEKREDKRREFLGRIGN